MPGRQKPSQCNMSIKMTNIRESSLTYTLELRRMANSLAWNHGQPLCHPLFGLLFYH